MPTYQFKARNAQGKLIKGNLTADTDKQAKLSIKQQNLLLIDIREQTKLPFWKKSFNLQKIKTEEVALFTRQLSTLLSAGLPISEVLSSISEQTEKNNFKQIIENIKQSIMEGQSLSEALAHFPKIFSPVYVATIQAGEQSGYLSVILQSLANYLEQQEKQKQKIQNALIYPAMMVCVSIGIVIFLLSYVVPKIMQVFTSTHQTLPLATVILLGISNFLSHYGIYLLLIFLILFFVAKHYLKKPNVKKHVHHVLLKLPLFGKTWLQINTARFAKTIGILFSANVPILQAMAISLRLVSIIPVQQQLEIATTQVKEGTPLNKALKATQYFSPMVLHLIASGENTGQLDKLLMKASEMQEETVANTIETSLKLLEPMIILLMGGVVLFIVLAVLLPIFALDQMNP